MAVEFVTLTEIELKKRSQELANKIAEKARVEVQKKSSAKDFKIKLEVLDTEIRDLSETVRTGEERREKMLWDSDIEEQK